MTSNITVSTRNLVHGLCVKGASTIEVESSQARTSYEQVPFGDGIPLFGDRRVTARVTGNSCEGGIYLRPSHIRFNRNTDITLKARSPGEGDDLVVCAIVNLNRDIWTGGWDTALPGDGFERREGEGVDYSTRGHMDMFCKVFCSDDEAATLVEEEAPAEEESPAEEVEATADEEEATAEEEEASEEQAPAEEEATAEDEEASEEQAPAEEEATAEEEEAPADEEHAPAEEEATAEEEQAPAEEEQAPAEEEQAPVEEEQAPAEEEETLTAVAANEPAGDASAVDCPDNCESLSLGDATEEFVRSDSFIAGGLFFNIKAKDQDVTVTSFAYQFGGGRGWRSQPYHIWRLNHLGDYRDGDVMFDRSRWTQIAQGRVVPEVREDGGRTREARGYTIHVVNPGDDLFSVRIPAGHIQAFYIHAQRDQWSGTAVGNGGNDRQIVYDDPNIEAKNVRAIFSDLNCPSNCPAFHVRYIEFRNNPDHWYRVLYDNVHPAVEIKYTVGAPCPSECRE